MDDPAVVSKLQALVSGVLAERGGREAGPVPEDADLIDRYNLDSMDAMRLLVQVETEFDVEIADGDLSLDLVRTVRRLADYVTRRMMTEASA